MWKGPLAPTVLLVPTFSIARGQLHFHRSPTDIDHDSIYGN